MIKQFHPYKIGVCSNEKENDIEFIFMSICHGLRDLNLRMNEHKLLLIADGFDVIRNAFLKVFRINHNIVMCWAHMQKCVVRRLCLVDDKKVRTEIRDDIDTLC